MARRTFSSQKTKHFSVKMHFGSADVKKRHATVARSAFPSQNAENMRVSGHFWKCGCQKMPPGCGAKRIFKSIQVKMLKKNSRFGPLPKLRRQKMARSCGPKRVFKSKCTKHLSVGVFLEVRMARINLEMLKT